MNKWLFNNYFPRTAATDEIVIFDEYDLEY